MGDLIQASELVFGVGVDDSSKGARGGLWIVDLGGIGVDGIDLHGHGEFAHVAVVKDAAARRDLKGALLLLLRAFDVFVVVDDLEPEETRGDGESPEEKEAGDQPETRQLHGRGARGGGAKTGCAECCLHC